MKYGAWAGVQSELKIQLKSIMYMFYFRLEKYLCLRMRLHHFGARAGGWGV